MKTMGQALATGHLRSTDRKGASSADELSKFVREQQWQKALVKYAQKYAAKVQEDYRSF